MKTKPMKNISFDYTYLILFLFEILLSFETYMQNPVTLFMSLNETPPEFDPVQVCFS